MLNRKTLKTRRYKAGYDIRTELVDDSEYGGTGIEMKTAYTTSGDYIGDPKSAYHLCKKMGIKPEKISSDRNVCSIGFCDKDQKWYGWSHRAIFGFGVGSTTKRGDCGFIPANTMELYASLSDDEKKRVVKADGNGITLEYNNVKQVPPAANVGEEVEWVPCEPSYHTIKPGRGDWTAVTLEEAKLMAIDFARSVS